MFECNFCRFWWTTWIFAEASLSPIPLSHLPPPAPFPPISALSPLSSPVYHLPSLSSPSFKHHDIRGWRVKLTFSRRDGRWLLSWKVWNWPQPGRRMTAGRKGVSLTASRYGGWSLGGEGRIWPPAGGVEYDCWARSGEFDCQYKGS